MKRNLIVIAGVLVLTIAGYFVPVASFPEKKWYMETMETIHITSGASVSMGLIILWFMQTNSKWRGALWIFLSIIGPIFTIDEVQKDYKWLTSYGLRIDPNYTSGEPSYDIGFYLILLGYVIVIAGSAWDIAQKRHQEKFSTVPSQTTSKESAA